MAKCLNGERIPCSGVSGKELRGDVFHNRLFVECKARERIATLVWIREAITKSKGLNKVPIVVMRENRRPGKFVLMTMEDFVLFTGECFK